MSDGFIQKIDTIIIDEYTNFDIIPYKMTHWIMECLSFINEEILNLTDDIELDKEKLLSIINFKDNVDFKKRYNFVRKSFLKYAKNKWSINIWEQLNKISDEDFYDKLKIKYNEKEYKIEYKKQNPIEFIADKNKYIVKD